MEFSAEGIELAKFGSNGSGGKGKIGNPSGLAISGGDLYVTEEENSRVQEFSISSEHLGKFERQFDEKESGSNKPYGIATAPSTGDLYVSEVGNNSVQVFSPEGTSISAFGSSGKETGDFSGPKGIAIGPSGSIYVADTGNNRVAEWVIPPSNTLAPAMSGRGEVGQTITVNPGTWTGGSPISYEYQWQSCEPDGEECHAIEGATASDYRLLVTDVERTVRVLVTASNAAGKENAISPASTVIADGPPIELEGPLVVGSPHAGATLQVDSGIWGGSESQISDQWERCDAGGAACAPISGATGSEYQAGAEDIGARLRARVGASNAEGSITDVTPPSEVIGAATLLQNTVSPNISGVVRVGETLTAEPGSWLGSAGLVYTYQWEQCDGAGLACEEIAGATEPSYVVPTEAVGQTFRVAVTVTEPAEAVTGISAATEPVAAGAAPAVIESPTVTGTTLVGYTVEATAGEFAGTGALSRSYSWQRCDEYGEACSAISGATASSYTVSSADIGGTLRVLVAATDSASHTTAALSPPVTVSADTLANRSQPVVLGQDHEGQVLSANPGVWTGAGEVTFSEQWQQCEESGEACHNIAGATTTTYEPGASDVGHEIRVVVTAAIGSESASVSSPTTPPIGNEQSPPLNIFEPTIEGAPTVGQTMSAEVGSWAGSEPISYSYQWERCDDADEDCVDIAGATTSTYVLSEADAGSLVRVAVTAANEVGSETLVSPPSEEIAHIGPPTDVEAPTISGVAVEGEQLTTSSGGWQGSRPLTFSDRWERCDAMEKAVSRSKAPWAPITC